MKYKNSFCQFENITFNSQTNKTNKLLLTNNYTPTNKLNLGCGTDLKTEFINADLYPINKSVIKLDLAKTFPFKNNEFDFVYCRHVLEHSPDIRNTLSEIYRICKNGALFEVIVPYVSNLNGAFCDFEYHNYFGAFSFDKLTKKHKRAYQYPFHFEKVEVEYSRVIPFFVKPLLNWNKVLSEYFWYKFFPIIEIRFLLKVEK